MERRDPQGSNTTELVDCLDRLSSMPNEILHHIFSSLQATELIQASVLSKRWRYLWTSMPHLNFDKAEMGNMDAWQGKFPFVVKCLLFLRDKSDIKTLRVSSPDQCDGWVVYWWLDIARAHNVQEIDFDIIPPRAWYVAYEMPALVFGKSLVSLKMNLNYRRMPITWGCEGLVALHLVSIVFPNECFVAEILSSCPLLEKLTMERCIMRHLNVLEILAANLKHLIFANKVRGTFHDNRSFGGVLRVVAPNLLSFMYYGYVLSDFQMESLSSLESASVEFLDFHERPDHYFCKMVKGFYNANVLRLSIPFFQLPPADGSQCFPSAFYNLKSLALCAGFDSSHLRMLIHLLKHFPCLEVLTIDCGKFSLSGVPVPKGPWFEAVSCLCTNLKQLELINSSGTESELEFVKFFLAYGKVLEEVTIPWNKTMESKVTQFQKAFYFPKASPNVVISFPKHHPQKPFWYSFA